MNDEQFKTLWHYFHFRNIGNGWLSANTFWGKDNNQALLVDSYIERMPDSLPDVPFYRITDAGIAAYYREKYLYYEGLCEQVIKLAEYAIAEYDNDTESNKARGFNVTTLLEVIKMLAEHKIQFDWKELGVIPINENPRATRKDQTVNITDPRWI